MRALFLVVLRHGRLCMQYIAGFKEVFDNETGFTGKCRRFFDIFSCMRLICRIYHRKMQVLTGKLSAKPTDTDCKAEKASAKTPETDAFVEAR